MKWTGSTSDFEPKVRMWRFSPFASSRIGASVAQGADSFPGDPDSDGCELERGEVVVRPADVAGGEAPEPLDTVEEALHEVALATDP